MQRYFLLTIGCYNLLGSITLYLMLNRGIAVYLLRRWAFIFSDTYSDQYGSVWLGWAATSNLFYSLLNLAAVSWDSLAQKMVIYGNLLLYSVFLGLTLLTVHRHDYSRKSYDKSCYINLFLFTIWIFWAIASLEQIS
jgi:hypothetical protein